MANEVTESVTRYINAIRNKSKKEFARKYYAFQCNYIDSLPDMPELGVMARQAVRHQIDAIYSQFGIALRRFHDETEYVDL